ncbi:MAG: helix-turn-helix domain-containing protein [Desulfobacteraceae bacterium]|nr:helix-turn-helix domain-containing protein [Desulfobacteraceae bacterium]
MGKDDVRRCYEMLELPADASPAEVRKAYLFLKKLYSTESIVTIPLEEELPPEARRQMREGIEEAYRRLAPGAVLAAPAGEKRPVPPLDDGVAVTGLLLREIRERLGIGLRDLALATHIQVQYLDDIEKENFVALPVYVYTRGYVASYASQLGLDPARVTADYMSRFAAARQDG